MKKHGTNLIYWVILAALGIFLIIGHNVALNIVCKVIGVALLLAAVSGVYSWWKTKSRKPEAIARLIGSLAFFGLGLWILTGHWRFHQLHQRSPRIRHYPFRLADALPRHQGRPAPAYHHPCRHWHRPRFDHRLHQRRDDVVGLLRRARPDLCSCYRFYGRAQAP